MNKSALALVIAGSLSLGACSVPYFSDSEEPSNEAGSVTTEEDLGVGPIAGNATFERLDDDDNGVLSEEELMDYGVPSAGPSEWKTMREDDRAAEMMQMLDTNGDGVVSPMEMEQSNIIEDDDPGAVVE